MELERYDPFEGTLGFSLAVRAGDAVHASGMVGVLPDGSVPDGLEAQMRQAYANLAGVLGELGARLENTATQTVFFVGDADEAVAAADATRAEAFGASLPASAMIGVDKLVDPRFVVEIQLTAYRD